MRTYELLAQKVKSIKCPHGLRGRLYVAIDNVRLASHLHGLEGDHIENRPIRREQEVQSCAQVVFLDVRGR